MVSQTELNASPGGGQQVDSHLAPYLPKGDVLPQVLQQLLELTHLLLIQVGSLEHHGTKARIRTSNHQKYDSSSAKGSSSENSW
eukprot:569247-Amphidinium_carterae.1